MNRCKSLTRAGSRCKILIAEGNYCEFHRGAAITPGEVSEIESDSTELPSGQVRYEKAKSPRFKHSNNRRRWFGPED